MKKLFLTLSIFSMLFMSCEKENGAQAIQENSTFINTPIAIKNNTKTSLIVEEDVLLKSVQKYLKIDDINIDPLWSEIVDIDEKIYLRIHSKNNLVSTTQLKLDGSRRLIPFGTTCTSIACASGGGCVPDGLYCTECVPDEDSTYAADCKRKTSSGSEPSEED